MISSGLLRNLRNGRMMSEGKCADSTDDALKGDFVKKKNWPKVPCETSEKIDTAPPVNRTRGPTMATLDFTTKPVVL